MALLAPLSFSLLRLRFHRSGRFSKMVSSNESRRVLTVLLLLPLLLTILVNTFNCNSKIVPPNDALSGLSVEASAPQVSLLTSQKRRIVRRYISDILQVHDTLRTLRLFSGLRPSAAVNKAFEKLVSISAQVTEESITDAILSDPRISVILDELQQFSSEGEGNLENHWAKEIVSAGQFENVTESLSKFPYYNNYVELTKMELGAIALVSQDNPPQTFAFLGSGPVPLTSLCIINQLQSKNQSVSILNVDHDPDANKIALHLSRSLHYPNSSMSFLHSKAEAKHSSLRDYDVVYVAALVGSNSNEKREIFSAVLARMRPGALLVIRTVHSLRQLLYPVVKVATDLDPKLFEPLMVVHPYGQIINSVIVGRARERKVKAAGAGLGERLGV